LTAILLGLGLPDAFAQQVDLTRGGPIEITATDGLEWHQNEQQVVARGNARAVRGNVTVTADKLVAYYRKKPGSAGGSAAGPASPPSSAAPASSAPPAAGAPASATPARRRAGTPAATPAPGPSLLGNSDSGSNEIYRVEAIGNVHIYTATDQVWGDRAIYDMDQAVMLMTGGNLRLTTPSQVLTARDSLEYWTQRRMAVARGNAVVVTNDAKRVAADTLVAFTKEDDAARRGASGATPTPVAAPARSKPARAAQPDGAAEAGSGKLQRVEAFGHVAINTPTETVTGDRGIYVAETGLARLGGNVRITRGQNQLNGSDAEVDLNTGVSRLLAGSTGRVAGLVVPNDPSNQALPDGSQPPAQAAAPPATGTRAARRRATPAPAGQTQGTQP
jgi:lipopolysaccharide export system protein LptA